MLHFEFIHRLKNRTCTLFPARALIISKSLSFNFTTSLSADGPTYFRFSLFQESIYFFFVLRGVVNRFHVEKRIFVKYFLNAYTNSYDHLVMILLSV